METHLITIGNYPSHPIEEVVKGNERDVYNFLTKEYFNKIDYPTLAEIKADGVEIKSYDHREFNIINGDILKFKRGRKIIGYIKQSIKGFKFCTGKPSDAMCLSWDYSTFNEAIKTASEYTTNYNSI